MLFTKEFLNKLEEKSKEVNILDFLMLHQQKSFPVAILELAQYLEMQPEFLDKKSSKNI